MRLSSRFTGFGFFIFSCCFLLSSLVVAKELEGLSEIISNEGLPNHSTGENKIEDVQQKAVVKKAAENKEDYRKALGNACWTFLHTIAARTPEKPSERRKARLAKFLELIGHLFPCSECARHFRGMLKKYPPQLNSQREFSLWLCNIHNMVNVRLNKPLYDCANVDQQYDCGCNLESDDDSESSIDLTEIVKVQAANSGMQSGAKPRARRPQV